MATFYTHTTHSMGDNIWALLYLRKQAELYPEYHFVHAAQYSLLPQLIEITSDLENLHLMDFEYKKHFSKSIWVGDFIKDHPTPNDVQQVLVDFYVYFSKQQGLVSGVTRKRDMLCDYPAIKRNNIYGEFDFLIINSRPISGQFPEYEMIDGLIADLKKKGGKIVTTAPNNHGLPSTASQNLSVSAIGGLSINCKYILGVPCGPIWPTFNIWNENSVKLRLMLVTPHVVDLCPNTVHVPNMAEARRALEELNLL